MCKAINPKYDIKKGKPPHCQEHNLPMVLSYCKIVPSLGVSCSKGKNPLSYKEDISFVKCSDGLFGHLPNLTKGSVEYRAYLVHITAKRANGTRAKNLIVKLFSLEPVV